MLWALRLGISLCGGMQPLGIGRQVFLRAEGAIQHFLSGGAQVGSSGQQAQQVDQGGLARLGRVVEFRQSGACQGMVENLGCKVHGVDLYMIGFRAKRGQIYFSYSKAG